jgi:hypothetical protein
MIVLVITIIINKILIKIEVGIVSKSEFRIKYHRNLNKLFLIRSNRPQSRSAARSGCC